MLKKYGVEHVGQLSNHSKKVQQTAIERYGSLKNAYYKTASKTIKQKYGVDNFSQSECFREKIRSNMIEKHFENIEEELNLKRLSDYKSYYELLLYEEMLRPLH